jgi:tetratricopeptide (TPR) repeat protein
MKKAGLALIVVLLLSASLLQWGMDRTPAGSTDTSRGIRPTAASLLDFMGGIRQYLAYTLFIKADKLYHTYSASGDLNKANLVPYFILITMLDPNYVDAYYIGSGLMTDLGREDAAIDFTLRGIQANPGSADLYYSLADLYLVAKRFEDARDAFIKALQYKPEIVSRFMIMRGLAGSYQALGDMEKSRMLLTDIAIYNEILKYDQYLSVADMKTTISQINIFFNLVAGSETSNSSE